MTTKMLDKKAKFQGIAGVRSAKSEASEVTARWMEARRAYLIYAALATQFELPAPPYPEGTPPPTQPSLQEFEQVLTWMEEIDAQVRAFQLRQLLPVPLNASEETLRAFTQRHLRKPDKTEHDRDKIDFLLVQYFALCAPENLYHQEISLEDVARVLQPVLSEADPTALEWCEPLDKILKAVEECHSMGDLMEAGLLEQGRLLKESAGPMFYDPAALVAFVRFNFVLRRAFIRLLHADLRAIREAVEVLDRADVKAVDCRRAGFSAAEPIVRLRSFCEEWRQPFHKDYTSSTVSRAFEQLIALRTDLEEALTRAKNAQASISEAHEVAAKPPATPKAAAQPAAPAKPAGAVTKKGSVARTESAKTETPAKPAAATGGSKPVAPKPAAQPKAPTSAVESTATADVEGCLEKIWEQLIDQPPLRGRSMSTVVLDDTKVLLSSWEVAAFVSEGGQDSEDLRRAVTARALLATAIDRRKRSGDLSSLNAALVHARSEVAYFQGRVEQAKRAKNTEAAVNLGISAKRLLSYIEEGEKIQA